MSTSTLFGGIGSGVSMLSFLTDTAGDCKRKFVDDVLRSAFAGMKSGRSGGGFSSSGRWPPVLSVEAGGLWSRVGEGEARLGLSRDLDGSDFGATAEPFFRRLDAAALLRGGEAGSKGGMSGGGGALARAASTFAASSPSLPGAAVPKHTSDGEMLRSSRSSSEDSAFGFGESALEDGAGFSSDERLKAMLIKRDITGSEEEYSGSDPRSICCTWRCEGKWRMRGEGGIEIASLEDRADGNVERRGQGSHGARAADSSWTQG